MPPTESKMIALGTYAPTFTLPGVDGQQHSLEEFSSCRALLVMFVCNHCPFVVHVRQELAKLYSEYADAGIGIVAISSNDSDAYPEDSFENMAAKAVEWNWKFPYLYDESQSVALAYSAACTPDFYLFDGEMKLVYRGQLDDSRPNNGRPVTGADIRHAFEAIIAGELPNTDQKPSVGCSIKWKPGNDPS